MGAVFEGCLKGIPSMGVSLYLQRGQRYEDHPVPEAGLTAVRELCRQLLQHGLPQDVCLNVNFPTSDIFRGFRVCRQARGRWSAEWATAANPHGLNAFWLTGTFTDLEPEATDTDFAALRAGFASIVPTQVDLTAYGVMEQVREYLS